MDLTAALQQGTAPLALAAMALVLGALHGLEPGHSKTMMAAFIIAVRGTVGQAVLLGLAAAVSHTVIVWVLALLALRFGETLIGARLESWFMVASGVLVVLIGLWMAARTWWSRRHAAHHRRHAQSAAPAEAAHARAHAREIESRFAEGRTTAGQTILFGLTGGLIPCSAAITLLLLCLHIDRFWMGVGLVGAFSVGLAVSLVAVGVAAALGLRVAAARTGRFDRWLARAPYVSAVLIVGVGLVMAYGGGVHLAA
jgi:nickel/cobalt exporter